MTGLRCIVFWASLLLSGGRRGTRANELHQARDALLPGGGGAGTLHRAAARAGILRDRSQGGGHRATPSGPRRAMPLAGSRAASPLAVLQDHGLSSSPWAKLAIASIDVNSRRNRGRGVSMMAAKEAYPGLPDKDETGKKLTALLDGVDVSTRNKFLKVVDEVDTEAKQSLMAGITGPLGFFDPLGFATSDTMTGGKLLFYREVELKHGRVAMLASLGFLVGEQFHPLFGGDIDVPSYVAFQETPLQTFWPAVVVAIAIPEVFSVFQFETPALFQAKGEGGGQVWSMRPDHTPGDLGFDPLGLRPEDPEELLQMRNKELNNGRLAMIAAAGMIAQELASGQKLF